MPNGWLRSFAPRNISGCQVGQGKYVPLCNHAGTVINDPIQMKRSDDTFWLSIADSDVLLWARGIAAERGLDVSVTEPDVSPLAVQGPLAETVVAHLCGDWVRNLKYFWFQDCQIEGIPVAVARSGWSKQGGFEIYLMDGSAGTRLWNLVKEAGKPHDIGPGNPNESERVESGLVSYGGDTDDMTNPFEVRMGPYVDLNVPDDVIGIGALRQIHATGPKRHQLGLVLDDELSEPHDVAWKAIKIDNEKIGDLTNCVRSYRMEAFIGFALVSVQANAGDRVTVEHNGHDFGGTLTDLPFL